VGGARPGDERKHVERKRWGGKYVDNKSLALLDKFLFETIAPRQVRFLTPPDYARADGLARAALDQMDRDFVIGPPITVHISNPELMTGIWSAARECLAAGANQRPRGEVIAATISRLNACPYCFDIHTSMLHSFGSHEAAQSLLNGSDLRDPNLQTIADWAKATLEPGAAILRTPPFAREELPGILGTALCFHYLNRISNVFLEGSAMLLNGGGWLKGGMVAMAGKLLRPRLTSQLVEPGEFLTACAGRLPPEFVWAEADPNIAGGFRRFAHAAEAAGEESVPPEVRECVSNHIGAWRGEAPALGRGWVENAVAPLAEIDRPGARVALLAALAPHQIDESLIAEFRAIKPRDRDLINVAAWAVYTAIRRIASWLDS
jgi:AhpD family alkylhydroperoxidase